MPSISHLPCLRYPFLRGCGKFTPTVTTDDLDLWMALQPRTHGLNRAIGEHVQRLACVQITNQRARASVAFRRPVVSSNMSDGRSGHWQFDGTQEAQQTGWTGGKPKANTQTRRARASAPKASPRCCS